MRTSLLVPVITLLGLAALPACTVNYYVPAATDAPVASNGPRRHPPHGQWQQVPGPPRQGQYSPVASAPTPTPQPGYPAPQPTGPVRQTPPPQPGPPRHGPVKEVPTNGPIRQTPAPAPAPSTPQTYPYPTGGVKNPKPVTPPAPAPIPVPAPVPPAPVPAPAPTYPYPTGGIKPSKPVDQAPVRSTESLAETAPTGTASPVPVPTPGPGKVGLEAEMQTGPVIVFGKTPCFGKCPHFTARLYANGRLQYEGLRYAPVEGNLDLMLDPAVVSRLLQATEESHFRGFKPEYTSGATDMAATTLLVNYPDGSVKSVRVEDGAPEELQKLLALVNSQIEKAVGSANDR